MASLVRGNGPRARARGPMEWLVRLVHGIEVPPKEIALHRVANLIISLRDRTIEAFNRGVSLVGNHTAGKSRNSVIRLGNGNGWRQYSKVAFTGLKLSGNIIARPSRSLVRFCGIAQIRNPAASRLCPACPEDYWQSG